MLVGFIGIGNMGWPMATKIAKAGREMTVFDLDGERSERFAAEKSESLSSSWMRPAMLSGADFWKTLASAAIWQFLQ